VKLEELTIIDIRIKQKRKARRKRSRRKVFPEPLLTIFLFSLYYSVTLAALSITSRKSPFGTYRQVRLLCEDGARRK
jgi:hypothetical protein